MNLTSRLDSKEPIIADHGPIIAGPSPGPRLLPSDYVGYCAAISACQMYQDGSAFHPVDGSEIWRSPGWGYRLVGFFPRYLPFWFYTSQVVSKKFGAINSSSLNMVNSHFTGTSNDINWPAWYSSYYVLLYHTDNIGPNTKMNPPRNNAVCSIFLQIVFLHFAGSSPSILDMLHDPPKVSEASNGKRL